MSTASNSVVSESSHSWRRQGRPPDKEARSYPGRRRSGRWYRLGVLRALGDFPEIKFEVWSLSCVGAWLGCLYHVSPDRTKKLEYVENLLRGFFREDKVYDKFPCPDGFFAGSSGDDLGVDALHDRSAILHKSRCAQARS